MFGGDARSAARAADGRAEAEAEDFAGAFVSGARSQPIAFSSVPVLLGAALFALGILLSHWVFQSLAISLAAVLLLFLLTLLALRRSSGRVVLVPLAALWLCMGLLCAEMEPAPPAQRQLLADSDGLSRKIVGRVIRVDFPRPTDTSASAPGAQAATSVDLAVETVEDVQPDASSMAPTQGGVRLSIYNAPAAFGQTLRCGDLVAATAQLRPPERFYDPGAWDYAAYLLEHGIASTASLPANRLSVIDRASSLSFPCRLHAAQAWAAGRIDGYVASRANLLMPRPLRLTAQDAGMLNAMLFGDRAHLDRTLRLGFERTGSFHLFVVSGLHLAVLAGLIFLLARKLRVPEPWATLLTIALAAGYALLTGFGLPVQRALAMTTVFLVARLMSRDRSPLNALGIAVLALLALHPGDLFQASFQMTALAIVAIGGVAIPLGERTFMPYAHASRNILEEGLDLGYPEHLAGFRIKLRLLGPHMAGVVGRPGMKLPAALVRWVLWCCELALVSCVAEVFMVLPMAVYFHRVTMLAVPANLVSIPFVGILLPLVLAMFLCSLASAWLALPAAVAVAALLHLTTWFVTELSHFHAADLRIPAPSHLAIACVLALWAFAVWAVRRRRAVAWAGIGALLVAAALVLWPERPLVRRGVLEVTALDVGQGDALLVVTPDGKTLLVDAGGPIGGPFAHNSAFDIGEQVVSPYLWSRRIRRLDAVALTHAHSDHMGGMPAVLRNFRPRELWVGSNPPDPAYAALLAEAKNLGIAVRSFHAGDSFDFGGARIQALSPAATYRPGSAPVNDDSLVLDVRYGAASALLEGDAEATSERAMLSGGEVGHATLLKVGHHGSKTSSTSAFVLAASPAMAVISVGRRNPFGHPRREVVSEFAEDHVALYRTDLMGAASFFLTRRGGISADTYEAH